MAQKFHGLFRDHLSTLRRLSHIRASNKRSADSKRLAL
jgi:hypothetical protein